MNILFLENEGSWRGQCLLKLNSGNERNIDFLTDIQLSVPLEELARNFAEEFPFVDLLFINVNLLAGRSSRLECTGISLLKYIRLYHFDKHCILYSFLSREQLIQLSPDNLIVFSEGVTFVHLPYDFSKLDLENLAKQKAPADLSRYLKAESRLPDDRHFFANWWGVLQLWKVHRYLHKIDKEISIQVEKLIFKSAKQKYDYQGKLAEYLYSKEIQKLSPEYIEAKKEQHSIFDSFALTKEAYEKSLIEHKTRIEAEDIEINRLSIDIDEIQPSNWWQIFVSKFGIVNLFRRKRNHYEYKKTELFIEEEQIQKYKEIKNFIELDKSTKEVELENIIIEIAQNIEIKKKKLNEEDIFNIHCVIQKLKETSPRILYIDDQADEGWATVFQLMIYGIQAPDNFSVINPGNSTIDELIDRCFINIKRDKPDLIILDLRLYGEKGIVADYENLSGIKVLKALKNGDCVNIAVTCPILVVTASDKAVVHNLLYSYRADASWIKEGLDSHFSLEDTVENYLDFLKTVFVLCCTADFSILRKMKEGILQLKVNGRAFWWESELRFENLISDKAKMQKVEKIDVYAALDESLIQLETLLHGPLRRNLSILMQKSLPSLIAMRLFHIIELIHNENVDKEYTSVQIEVHHKNDSHGKLNALTKLRNDAVHQISLSLQDLDTYLTYLFEYLEVKPKSNQTIPTHKYPLTGKIPSQNANGTNKRYTSVIIIKRHDCIVISKFANELQKDFELTRNLLCFEKNVMRNVRAKEDVRVQFEVKQIGEDNFIAINVTIL